MVTVIAWVVVMLVVDGVTSTVGVALVTVTPGETPVALPYTSELEVSGAKLAVRLIEPSARELAGMLIVAVPALSVAVAEV
jgi:hypothetical protein